MCNKVDLFTFERNGKLNLKLKLDYLTMADVKKVEQMFIFMFIL